MVGRRLRPILDIEIDDREARRRKMRPHFCQLRLLAFAGKRIGEFRKAGIVTNEEQEFHLFRNSRDDRRERFRAGIVKRRHDVDVEFLLGAAFETLESFPRPRAGETSVRSGSSCASRK